MSTNDLPKPPKDMLEFVATQSLTPMSGPVLNEQQVIAAAGSAIKALRERGIKLPETLYDRETMIEARAYAMMWEEAQHRHNEKLLDRMVRSDFFWERLFLVQIENCRHALMERFGYTESNLPQ